MSKDIHNWFHVNERCWRTNLLSDNGPPITFIITLEWQVACAFTLKRLLSTNRHEPIINSLLCLIYLLSSIHSPFSVFLWIFRLTEIPRNAVDRIKENLHILFIEILHQNLEIHRHVNSLWQMNCPYYRNKCIRFLVSFSHYKEMYK